MGLTAYSCVGYLTGNTLEGRMLELPRTNSKASEKGGRMCPRCGEPFRKGEVDRTQLPTGQVVHLWCRTEEEHLEQPLGIRLEELRTWDDIELAATLGG